MVLFGMQKILSIFVLNYEPLMFCVFGVVSLLGLP